MKKMLYNICLWIYSKYWNIRGCSFNDKTPVSKTGDVGLTPTAYANSIFNSPWGKDTHKAPKIRYRNVSSHNPTPPIWAATQSTSYYIIDDRGPIRYVEGEWVSPTYREQASVTPRSAHYANLK